MALVFVIVLVSGCSAPPAQNHPDAGQATPTEVTSAPPPPLLAPSASSKTAAPSLKLRCPKAMVSVAGKFCIDKWEASLVDKTTGIKLSPYYPPDRKLAEKLAEIWDTERFTLGDERAQKMPLPPLSDWQREHEPEPMAVSKRGVTPNGYLSAVVAAKACENAKKRLCRRDEWLKACRGEADRPFPYGDSYVQGACNIFRSSHPALVLHENPSVGHLDPRLNLVTEPSGEPLLRATGATSRCKSEWGRDAAYDMNGNIDEWVDSGEPTKGTFAGGFYARSRRDGCMSSVSSHDPTYFDYSTGTRCCLSPDAL